MKYFAIPARELSDDLIERWRLIQQTNDTFASPYFCPDFTQAVARVRRDVYVGLIEDAGRVVGFFPHHRRWDRVARPVGLRLCDYHGVVVDTSVDWRAEDLLRGCRLVRWEFDHLPARQHQFSAGFANEEISPIAELHHGFDAFKQACGKNGRKQIREAERKAERLAQRAGPLRFVENCDDKRPLECLLKWKSKKCQQTGVVDFFAIRWCRALIEQLMAMKLAGFGAPLSVLYAGDDITAVHLGLATARVRHSWFPAYDERFAADSPGAILLLHLLKCAAEAGVDHFDFGKDVSVYKSRYMTGAIPLAQGRFEVPSVVNCAARWRSQIESWSRRSRLRAVLRHPGRLIHALEHRGRYD